VARGSGAVHLRRTGGRRSKDLANSGARRVRAQVLGIQSHEDARSEKVNSRWIQIAGGPLDLHVGSCIGASREKARELDHVKAKSRGSEVASFGTSDIGSRRGSYSTSRVAKSRVVRSR
jgi:hypothetical protein